MQFWYFFFLAFVLFLFLFVFVFCFCFCFCFCFVFVVFVFVFFLFRNNPVSSSICKLPIRSEIYNCTFKNTNKVSIIIIIIILLLLLLLFLLLSLIVSSPIWIWTLFQAQMSSGIFWRPTCPCTYRSAGIWRLYDE